MKVAYFEGDCRSYWLGRDRYVSMDEIMRDAQTGERPEAALSLDEKDRSVFGEGHAELLLVLVPDDFDLTTLNGDDWDDRPADCNASRPYGARVGGEWVDIDDVPGVVTLHLRLGDRLGGVAGGARRESVGVGPEPDPED